MTKHEKNQGRQDMPMSPDRRRVLAGLGLAGGVMAGGFAHASTSPNTDAHVTDAPISDHMRESQPFYGRHQAGIVTARPANGMIATFDVLATTKEDLVRLFRMLTDRIVFLTSGGVPPQLDPRYPPSDSGILGPVVVPDNLTMTVSLGSSMFDDRFGLKDFRPAKLSRMTGSPNDALESELCHGDISVQICSNTADVNIHALRDIVKNMPDLLYLRWKQEGSVPVLPSKPGAPAESARNFLGFRDGSANPNSSDDALMNEIVWVQPGKGDQAWASYGSYQAVRIIRNFVERWDRTPLHEQQQIMGRVKTTGAPFDGKTEVDVPNYANDPHGKATPFDSHIRLANPRTLETEKNLILRRPFNYSNGVSKAGQLEMGLLFICYQADLEKGFITVQKRLDGEPLEEYLKPIGGGFFFTLPGVRGKEDYLGRTLLAAASLV